MPLAESLRRDTSAFRLIVLILTTIAARAATFGSPVVHVDESFYLTVANAMAHGAIAYVDAWDRKPVGLFLLYLPAAVWGLPAALYVYQAMAAAAAVATAWIVARLADRAGWRAGALPAAMFYLLWLNLADGEGGQSPVFYNLPMAMAAWLALGAVEGRGRIRGVAAMLLVGVALQIKYSVVFEGIAFGSWSLVADWRRRRSMAAVTGYALALVLAALVPTALVAVEFVSLGHFSDFVFANFVSILHRGRDTRDLALMFVKDDVVILAPLLLALAGSRGDATSIERRVQWYVRGWLIIALVAFIGFGGWYNHYTLPVMLPGAVAIAAMLERRRRSIWWAIVPLVLLFVAGQIVLRSERARRGTPAQFAALATRVGSGPGGLFVYSGPVLLYPATGRPALTRYLFPSHLEFAREAGSIGVDQEAEIERVFARLPGAVVIGPPIREERPAIRALVLRLLATRGYRAGLPVMLGHDAMLVYRRPTS